MSYSFNVRRSTKEEAIAAVIAEMDKVVASQPIHATDREPTIETAKAFINMIPEDASKDVNVNVSGSVSWSGTYPDSHTVIGANVSVSAGLWNREAA